MSGKAIEVQRTAKDKAIQQRVYQLDPPLSGHEYVVVSAAIVPLSGPETYIFPSDAAGTVTAWGELDGSYRGGLDHAEAMRRAGYEIGGAE